MNTSIFERTAINDNTQRSFSPDPSTLWQLLHSASESPGKIFIYPPGSTGEDAGVKELSYKALLQGSEDKANLLRHLPGLTKERIVLLHFDNHTQNIEWLWAISRAGLVAAVSTPFSADLSQRYDPLIHLKNLLQDPILLTSTTIVPHYPEVQDLSLCTVEALQEPNGGYANGLLASKLCHMDRPAVLVLTSGSTGDAKAVPLTVPQIIASLYGKSEALRTDQDSVFLNWIGVDHVANLTEVHLHAMKSGAKQVHIEANDLLADPLLFVRLLAKHHVTHFFAPNFFLAMLEKSLVSRHPSDPVFSVDLSNLKSIVSGTEANVVRTAENLSNLLNRLKTRDKAICIGYGLTEACAALTYGTLDPKYEAGEGHEFASMGRPITGAEIRVSRDDGTLADLYETGNLEISGPVIFKGYYHNAAAAQNAFTADGWYITGDRVYIDSSDKVNMSGRAKEVIVINGVKHSPVDVEAAIKKASLPGIMPS